MATWWLGSVLAVLVAAGLAAAQPPPEPDALEAVEEEDDEFAPDESVGKGGPLEVAEVAPVVGDGRTLIAVPFTGGPAPLVNEREEDPARPWLTCAGAATLPGSRGRNPVIIAPAVRAPNALACLAHLRRAEVPFSVPLTPPPPGLYAQVSAARPYARDPNITLTPFVVSGGGVDTPAQLFAAASGAQITVAASAVATLALGGDKAPRAVVVALSDGERHGAVFIPVTARTELPVKARRKAMVEVRVAGRAFGPIKATRGRLTVPVEVPVGTTTGVVRARGRAGNVREQLVDLHTPIRSRVVGLLPRDAARAGEETLVVVAAAGADGRPAPESAPPKAEAEAGQVGAVTRIGPGLWTVAYGAPPRPGEAEMMIRLDGNPTAGEDALTIPVVAGPPAEITLDAPPGPFAPGDTVTLTAAVTDRVGNPLAEAPVTVTLPDGTRVSPADDSRALEVPLPTTIPPGGELTLAVVSGGAESTTTLQMLPGPAEVGRLEAEADGREARLVVDVRDTHGNLVPTESFELEVQGGRAEELRLNGNGFAATLIAEEDARLAQLRLRVEETVLDEATVEFGPPTDAWMVGASVTAGLSTNLGAIAAPRVALDLSVRTGLGPFQMSAGVRGSYIYHGSQSPLTLGGAERTIDVQLHVVGVSLPLRLRYPISETWGVSIAGEPQLTWVGSRVDPGFQAATTHEVTVFGGAGEITGDVALGPGRVLLTVRYGSSPVAEGPVQGELDGLSVMAGYAWYFWDLGG